MVNKETIKNEALNFLNMDELELKELVYRDAFKKTKAFEFRCEKIRSGNNYILYWNLENVNSDVSVIENNLNIEINCVCQ